MTIKITATISGDKEVTENFKRIESDIRVRLRKAMIDAGESVRDLARGLAPRKSGALASSIKATFRESGNGMTSRVGPPKFYGRFFETGLHTMRSPPRTRGIVGVHVKMKGGSAVVKPRRGFVPSKAARPHTFTLPAHPFMTPAVDALRSRIETALAFAVKDE